jgi:FkbM family methyltransferase
MREARVLLGPAKGHRFELASPSPLYRMRNRGSVALGRYEPKVTAFLAERLRSCQVFFDIGAHTGYYTRIALSLMAADGKVIAFEPDPKAAIRLRQTFSDPRLSVRSEAAGREDHDAVLEWRQGLASRVRDESIAGPGYKKRADVRVRSLDGLVDADQVPPADLVKVDVEGGELLVLEGMSRMLQNRPAAVVECHSMQLLHDVLSVFINHGYDHLVVTHGGDRVGPPTVLAATS